MQPIFKENSFLMHGQEHFYEVAVKEKNSIVKVYDSTAKLRMSRRISLPKGNPVPCENFLIFYDESYITLVDVIAIQGKTYKGVNRKIKNIVHAIYNPQINLFFLVDDKKKLYYLMDDNNKLMLKQIYQSSQQITKLCSDKSGRVYLHSKSKNLLIKLKFDWQNNDLLQMDQRIQEIEDIYFRYHWEVYMHSEGQKEVRLSINNDSFVSTLEKSNNIMIKGNTKEFLYMDLSSSRIIMIYKGEMIDYVFEESIMNLWNKDKFLFDVSELSQKYLRLKVFVYKGMEDSFAHNVLDISRFQGNDINLYVQNNVELIMKGNGLIYPHFTSKVMDFLKDNELQLSSSTSLEELSYYFLEMLFKILPQSAIKLASHLTKYKKQFYVVVQFSRFLDHLNQFYNRLSRHCKELFFRIKNNISIIDEVDDQMLRTIRTSINFLSIIQQIVWEEVYDVESNFDYDNKFSSQSKNKIERYRKLIERGKSLYLIANMLADQKISLKIQKFKKNLFQNVEASQNLCKTQHQWKINFLIPTLCPQFFLNEQQNSVKDYEQKFEEILFQNQEYFYRIAYFYESILGRKEIPYISQSSLKEFIEFLVYEPFWTFDKNIQSKVRQNLPKIVSRALLIEDKVFLRYLCQTSVYYEEYKSCLAILLSKKIYGIQKSQNILIYYVICNRMLLGFQFLQGLIEDQRDELTYERIVRNFGKICERNSNIKDIFKIKNGRAKEILLDEIKKERGDEIDEIQRLIENY